MAESPQPAADKGSPVKFKNPVNEFMELSRNKPIMYNEVEEDDFVDRGDVMAPMQVWKYSRRLWAQLLAEFVGLAIFQIYGGSANDSVAAYGNGLTLAVIIWATANVSGGHLNPAVTFATCLTGHMSWGRGGLYVLAQILGGIFGALMQCGLIPHVEIGMGAGGPGCFSPLKGVTVTGGQLFFWELVMTFVLVTTVYATAVTKPGHGNVAPLAIGYSLFASAFVGGPYTGAALNPARVLGPAIVYHCSWQHVATYVFGELFGGVCAAFLVMPLYGFGQFGSLFDTRMLTFLGLSDPKQKEGASLRANDALSTSRGANV